MTKHLLRFGPEFVITALAVLGLASLTALGRDCNGISSRVHPVTCGDAVAPYLPALLRHFGIIAFVAIAAWVVTGAIIVIARRKPILERIKRDEIAAAAQRQADLDAIDRLLEKS
jgi:hypothetical protein